MGSHSGSIDCKSDDHSNPAAAVLFTQGMQGDYLRTSHSASLQSSEL